MTDNNSLWFAVRQKLANLMMPICDEGCDTITGLCDVDNRRLNSATEDMISLIQQYSTKQEQGVDHAEPTI